MAVAELPAQPAAERGEEREYRCRYCGRVFFVGFLPQGYFRIICPGRDCRKAQLQRTSEFRRRLYG